jgi:hypothetical protein
MTVYRRIFGTIGPVSILTFALNATDTGRSFIGNLNNIETVVSTVPANMDQNPYGVAVVSVTTGSLEAGSILVSNFNNAANQQGTGTTIVEIDSGGHLKTFAEINPNSLPGPCPRGVGLTTALTALRSGYVIVGMRIVLVTPNIGTPFAVASTVIASGFAERTDPNALVIGPTGLGFSLDGRLFVADTLGNRITAISNPLLRQNSDGTGTTLSEGGALNGPLGLVIAPNGDIVTVNSNDGNMVETTPAGQQVAVKMVDVSGTPGVSELYLASPSHQITTAFITSMTGTTR